MADPLRGSGARASDGAGAGTSLLHFVGLLMPHSCHIGSVDRRDFLLMLGAGLVAAFAGCSQARTGRTGVAASTPPPPPTGSTVGTLPPDATVAEHAPPL